MLTPTPPPGSPSPNLAPTAGSGNVNKPPLGDINRSAYHMYSLFEDMLSMYAPKMESDAPSTSLTRRVSLDSPASESEKSLTPEPLPSAINQSLQGRTIKPTSS